MKKLLFLLLAIFAGSVYGQTSGGVNWGQYYVSGTLTVGQGNTTTWAHPSSLLQIGKDTAAKGYRLAWVTDTGAITGTKIFGLQVWQWKDSSEYVWLGTRWRQVVKPTSGGGGSTDSAIFSTNYRVDTFRTRVNTALNTKVNTSDYNTLFDARLSLKTTDNVAEGAAQYHTAARARAAISLTTTGTSGAATYNSSTGVINIPQYAAGTGTVTSIATTTGTGITGGTITTSGTLALDTTNTVATKAQAQKKADSLGVIAGSKVGYVDTAAMLSPYVRGSRLADTAAALRVILNTKVDSIRRQAGSTMVQMKINGTWVNAYTDSVGSGGGGGYTGTVTTNYIAYVSATNTLSTSPIYRISGTAIGVNTTVSYAGSELNVQRYMEFSTSGGGDFTQFGQETGYFFMQAYNGGRLAFNPVGNPVTINGTASSPSSASLDIQGNSRYFYPNRGTNSQKGSGTPAAGAMYYCTDCTATDASTGVLQVYNGTSWKNCW